MAAYTTIDDPELYFQTKLYTGNGTDDRAITLDGDENMQPDWVWIKERDDANAHYIFDSVRGIDKQLQSNSTAAEYDYSGDANRSLKSFTSDGFTLGTGAGVNGDGELFVAWNWKKQAGVFDIQTYTGNGSARTISHNLGAVPKMMIIKKRNTTAPWSVGHASLGANQVLELDATDAVATDATYWNNTRPTSSVFTVGTDGNQNTDGHTYVIYLFGNKQGVSKCASYTGNGNADGTFVYTGFKPAFVMIKITDNASQDWFVLDNKRSPFNLVDDSLAPNQTDAEYTSEANLDFTAQGFKLRMTSIRVNGSGNNYIYMAFAENPFVTSTGVPATAR